MKYKKILIPLLALSFPAISFGQTVLLSVDFGASGEDTETGFSSFGGALDNTTTSTFDSFTTDGSFTSGTTTISLTSDSGNLDSRNRDDISDSGAFTYGDLYEDFAFSRDAGSILTIEFSGLNANTGYVVTFFAFDRGGATPPDDTITNIVTHVTDGASSPTGQTTFNPTVLPTDNLQHGIVLTAVSNSSGVLTFDMSSTGRSTNPLSFAEPRLAGLQIATIPEPSTYALLLAVAVAGCAVTRRRRHSS